MAQNIIEQTARSDYRCSCGCGGMIYAGTQYICITDHSVSYSLTPKGLYHNRYINKHHNNSTSRFLIGHEPK